MGPFDVIDLPDLAAEGIIPILFWPGVRLYTELFHPEARVSGPVRIGFAGRLDVRKGVTTLFEAIPTVLAKNPDEPTILLSLCCDEAYLEPHFTIPVPH